jgi:hypothetical protein
MPILGIVASSNYPRVTDTGAYYPLGLVNLTSASASATFSNIPQTYTHLELRYIVRGTTTASSDFIVCRFNSDGNASNYVTYHSLTGNGSSVTAASGLTGVDGAVRLPAIPTAQGSWPSGVFGSGIISILDYTNTNKYTTTRTLGGVDRNGGGELTLVSGLYLSTAAITAIQITPNTVNLAANSSFALYGIKGA